MKTADGWVYIPGMRTGINREVRNLHPETAIRLGVLLYLAKAAGLPVMLFEGWRSAERQTALYSQGRDGMGGKVVTNAKAGQSWHCYGLACDVVFVTPEGAPTWERPTADWQRLGLIGEQAGFMWGGRFKSPDSPHFEWHPGWVRDLTRPLDQSMRSFWEGVRQCWS